jgi:type I restriction enzyme S subunit
MSFLPYASYKDSGVEWLGKVPVQWNVRRIGYYFTERREKVSDKDYPALSVTKNGVVPQLDTAAKSDDGDNRKRVCKGDFVINSRSDRKGSAGTSKLEGSVSLICTVMRPQEKVYTPFVHHLLRSYPFQEEFYRNGKGIVADLWSTNYAEMRNILVGMPPFSEQVQIASFLDCETGKIDSLVAEQRRLMDLLDEKRQAIISRAVTKGLNPDVPMKSSGVEWLGEVPETWQIAPLRRLVAAGTTITYGIVQAGPDIDGGIPYIRTSDMSGEFLAKTGYMRTSPEIDAAYARSKVKPNDLVVAIRASLGKGLLVPDFLDGANLTQGTARISPCEDLMPRFLMWAFNSAYCQTSIRVVAKGSTFLEITLGALRRIQLALPPMDEQLGIVAHLDQVVGQIDALTIDAQRAISLLEERRTALISAAVTGQIDVRHMSDREVIA